ncbi:MAG: hypothetical protein H7A01_04430 [Hahellaceae bacterium]|nr:hypothetical protein [Hahellaceae bacterium]MCP5213249.1 hypothetical protein [Hahellaceae bacterium]
MAGNSDNKKPLSGKDLTAYERWELPVIDEEGNEFPAESLRVKPLTAADLEKIHDEAFAAGREAGEAEGKAAGHKAGLAKGTEEGKKQGYEAGFSTGRKEAYAAAEGEIKETQTRLAELMQALLDPIRKSEDKVEEALLNLTLAISRAVICRELNTDSSHISQIVKEALALLPEVATQVRLFIHPKDEAAVRDVVTNADLAARIIATPEIHPGGCKVETSSSLIDFTVEKRFQKTVQQILESVGQKSTVDDAPDLTDAMEDMTNFHRELLDVPPDPKKETPTPEPLVAQEPSALEEPSVREEPSAHNEPSADEELSVTEKSAAPEKPAAPEKRSTVDETPKSALTDAPESPPEPKVQTAPLQTAEPDELVDDTVLDERPLSSEPPKESVSDKNAASVELPADISEKPVLEQEPVAQADLPKVDDEKLQRKPEDKVAVEPSAEVTAPASEGTPKPQTADIIGDDAVAEAFEEAVGFSERSEAEIEDIDAEEIDEDETDKKNTDNNIVEPKVDALKPDAEKKDD